MKIGTPRLFFLGQMKEKQFDLIGIKNGLTEIESHFGNSLRLVKNGNRRIAYVGDLFLKLGQELAKTKNLPS